MALSISAKTSGQSRVIGLAPTVAKKCGDRKCRSGPKRRSILRPLKGPCISKGRGIVLTKANDDKKAAAQAAAARSEDATSTSEGKVLSVIDNKLMMRNLEGKEHSHILAKDVLLTCDGAICTADSLRTGNRIRVTTMQNNRNIAICIESLDKNADFTSF